MSARGLTVAIVCAAFVLSCAIPSPVQGQLSTAIQRFDEAAQLYNTGNFSEAIAAYEEVLAAGHVSGTVYYGMGNAYYRTDQYGQAIRYWEKARRLMGDHPAILHNLDLVRSRLPSPFSAVPPPFWVRWWQTAVTPVGLIPYLAAGLTLFLVAIVLFAVWIRTRTRDAWHRRFRIGSLIMGSALLLLAAGVSRDAARTTQGVVITAPAYLIEESDEAGSMAVPEGVVVTLIRQEGDLYRVRLPNGVEGHLGADTIGDI